MDDLTAILMLNISPPSTTKVRYVNSFDSDETPRIVLIMQWH